MRTLCNAVADHQGATDPQLKTPALNGCCMDSCPKVMANRVSVANLKELLLQEYDHDFSESSEDKMEMSFEDNRFMTRAESSLFDVLQKSLLQR